jgi:hypothetical protein
MEGSCSTGQSPQWAVMPVEEEEEVSLIIAPLIRSGDPYSCLGGTLPNLERVITFTE